MNTPRTTNFVNWDRFIECKDSNIIFVLDFYIDAGFSFTTAVAFKKMKITKNSVALDDLHIPPLELNLSRLPIKGGVRVESLSIESAGSFPNDTTERYFVSVRFSLNKIDYAKIEKTVALNIEKYTDADRSTHLRSYLSALFLDKAKIVRDEIISFIEFSGFLAKQIPATLNLYLSKGELYSRITQAAGGQESAGHNPVHPLALRAKKVITAYKYSLSIPDALRQHHAKGVHYKFLGFYDESFLCFYKIIETRFRSDGFCSLLARDLFNMSEKKLIATIKSSSPKTMMLFIYQKLTITNTDKIALTETEKSQIMNSLIDLTEARNKIAHSADHSTESARLLGFAIWLSKYMIASLKAEEAFAE
ncbi:hypothetical protein [Pseudomonas fluorescens]|uniref:Apea-like HEPN domain-containing protein n=1 Tax=Pseudomonas fluorescens TaxID=294 RepID=A0A4Y9TID3_PSEFL|nr:hypothetical protein [Pseudomonas fluorescens]TFW43140.1 hypothetical protein E4T65_12305 [Pseudomonas fluorescens]